MKRILFDINVVLDLLLDRAPWVNDAKTLMQAGLDGRAVALLSSASVGTLYYLIRKQAGEEAARRSIHRTAIAFEIVPVDSAIVARALELNGPDLEDDLQIATAERAGAEVIVTRDLNDYARSPIRALDPATTIRQLGLA